MGNALRSVYEHGYIVRVGNLNDTLHVIDSAERVVYMTHADKPCAGRDDTLKLREYQVSVTVSRDSLERAAFLMAHLLPGYYVGMMVQFRYYHLIAGCQILASICLGHQVDALSGAAYEYDLLAAGGVYETLHFLTCLLICIGGTCRQGVRSTVYVAVVVPVIVTYLVYHLNRFLRSGAVVQPYQVMTVNLLVKDREILLDQVWIEGINLIVVEVMQFLRLGYPYAESVILRDISGRPRSVIPPALVRHVGESASTGKQLSETGLQLLQIKGLVRQYALTDLPCLLRTVFGSQVTQQSQRAVILSLKTVYVCKVEHHFSTLFLC